MPSRNSYIVFVVLAIGFVMPVCLAEVQDEKDQLKQPTVFELLDKYAATQKSLQSFIARYVNTYSLTDTTKPERQFGRQVAEIRIDGDRVHYRANVWSKLATQDEPTPKENAYYKSFLWDGNSFFEYRRGKTGDAKAFISSHNKPAMRAVSYLGAPLCGVYYGDLESVDLILRQASSISLPNEPTYVGDSKCYVINAVTKHGKYSVWIDPEHGYNIAKADVRKERNDLAWGRPLHLEGRGSSIEALSFSLKNVLFEKIDRVWVPMEADYRFTMTYEDGRIVKVSRHHKRTSIELNPNFEADIAFVPDIADGTRVYVIGLEGQYSWRDGEVVDSHGFRISLDPNQPRYLPVLVGKALPRLDGINIEFSSEQAKGKKVLFCFLDMNQRPSRHLVPELTEKAKELKAKNIVVVCIQASKIDKSRLRAWIRRYKIGFPVGMIKGDEEKMRFAWGVKALPWLILTDREHVVEAEGFALDELDKKATHYEGDLLTFVVERNEAGRGKIKTAEYTVKWTADVEMKEGLRRSEGLGEVKMKGGWRFSTMDCNASIPATGWKQKQNPSMVINDKYLACWPSIGNANIQQWDHESINKLSEQAEQFRALVSPPDIYAFGVAFGGSEHSTFKEQMKLHPGKIKWTAEEAKQPNGKTVYLIQRYSPFMNDRSKPDGVWTIDPQKGFLVTEAVFYGRAGNVWITRKTEPREIGSGIWVPVSYQKHRYDKPTDPPSSRKPTDTITIQLEDITINHEIPDDCFVLESILPEEYRESTELVRIGLDGSAETYVYRYGRFIPRKKYLSGDFHTVSLINKPLPSLKDYRIVLEPSQIKDKSLLVCFFDMQQRPSRNMVAKLAKRAQELKGKGVAVVCVQASKVAKAKLDGWLKQNDIPFATGMIEADEEKVRFAWGVKALPWLILTDAKHVVTAEGFRLEELAEKMKKSGGNNEKN